MGKRQSPPWKRVKLVAPRSMSIRPSASRRARCSCWQQDTVASTYVGTWMHAGPALVTLPSLSVASRGFGGDWLLLTHRGNPGGQDEPLRTTSEEGHGWTTRVRTPQPCPC